MQKIKVGISQGDINGVGYEVILKTFASEEMLSLCIPVIFGSPKVAVYYRKSVENAPNFNVVDRPEKARDGQLNIVDLQTPVMLNQEASTTSAQVVDAYSLLTPTGEVSMTLVCYRWPNSETETMNLRNDYTGNYAPDGDAYSFTSSRADFS